jgi:hypothetical protein
MTSHLTSEEFVDALEGRTAASCAGHLDACEACRRQLDELRSVTLTIANDEVPEPSPLFWNHFSQRVRAATEEIPPAGLFGWRFGWRTLVMAAAAGTLVVTVAIQSRQDRAARQGMPSLGTTQTSDQAGAIDLTANQEAWDFMMQLASDVPADDLRGLSAPTAPGAADALTQNLTPDQQRELVRLLKAEIGGTE